MTVIKKQSTLISVLTGQFIWGYILMSKKKDLIYESALQAFAQYGYTDTTMDTIAEFAQVAKGTLYYHFKTKEELFYYVNQKGVEMLMESVKGATEDSSLTPQERLLHVLDEHLRFFSDNSEFCLLLLSFSSGDITRDNMVRTLLGNYFSLMEKYLANMQEQGFIKSDMETQTVVSALFGSIGFVVLRKMFRNEPVYTLETRDTLLILFKGALGLA